MRGYKRCGSAPASHATGAHPAADFATGGHNVPGTVYEENRQIHIPDLDNIDPVDGRTGLRRPRARRRHPHHLRHAAAARGQGDRRADRVPRPARALHGRRTGAAAKLRRPGRDRHRECAAVQRDAGGAGAADRDIRHPEGDRELAVRRAAGVRAIAESAKRCSVAILAAVTRFVGDMRSSRRVHRRQARRAIPELQELGFPTPTLVHARIPAGRASRKHAVPHRYRERTGRHAAIKELARARGYRSMLVVPMLRDGVPIGTIGVTRPRARPFARQSTSICCRPSPTRP